LDYASIVHVKAFQKTVNKEMPVHNTPGGKGSEFALYDLLKEVIKNKPPIDNSTPLLVKFAFDRATMTSGKRIKQEVGTFEFLYNGITLFSPNNAYQYIIYWF
jgi:hypothetical protein